MMINHSNVAGYNFGVNQRISGHYFQGSITIPVTSMMMRLKMNDDDDDKDDDEDRDEWSNCLFDSWLQNKRAIVRPRSEDQNFQRLSSCQIVNNKLSNPHSGQLGVRSEWDLPPRHLTSI